MNTRVFLHAYAHWSISPAQNGHHVNCGITHIKTPSFKSTRLLAFLASAVRRGHNDHLLTTWKAEKQNMCTPSSYFVCFPLSTYTKTAALLLSLICFSTAPQTIWKALKKNTKNKLHIAMHGGRLSSQWRRVVEEASLLRTIYYETTSSTGLVPSPLGVCCASILAKGCLYLDIRRTSHYTLERQSFFIWPDWQVEQPSGSLSLPLQSLCLSYLPKPSSLPFPPLSKSSNYLPYSSCHRPVLPAACRASHQPLPLLAFDSIYAGGEACDFWDIWEIDRSTDHQIPQPVKLLKSNTVEIVGP